MNYTCENFTVYIRQSCEGIPMSSGDLVTIISVPFQAFAMFILSFLTLYIYILQIRNQYIVFPTIMKRLEIILDRIEEKNKTELKSL